MLKLGLSVEELNSISDEHLTAFVLTLQIEKALDSETLKLTHAIQMAAVISKALIDRNNQRVTQQLADFGIYLDD
ncbi:MAG TPA: hypothetical protein VGK74_22445 [Symbiobacteriaceae bacterium]